jgi:hypothetical protein
MQRVCRLAAVGLALSIAFVTLAPLRFRPRTGFPQVERFAAYFPLSAVFSVACRSHRAAARRARISVVGQFEF